MLDIRVYENEELEKTYQEQLQNSQSEIDRLRKQLEV